MKIVNHDIATPIRELPIEGVHVVDNWLPQATHHYVHRLIHSMDMQLTNQVMKSDGTYAHRFWGTPLFIDGQNDPETYYPLTNRIKEEGYTTKSHVFKKFMSKLLCNSFEFDWEYLEYMGTNGQTLGLQGTIHQDSNTPNNISFLYYDETYWDPAWGGQLHFYDMNEEKALSIDYIPNRLLFFDGRIRHSADSPIDTTYQIRTSFVIRGDVRLRDK